MRIATAALKKELRIMRTPDDSSKLPQQVFWNKKIEAMLDRSVIIKARRQEYGCRLYEIAAHLGLHYRR